MLDIDIIRRHAQFSGNDLGKGRFMSLSLRLHSNSGQYLARGMNANLTTIDHLNACDIKVLARTSTDDLGEGRDANAHQLTTCTLFGLLAAQSFVVYVLHCQLQSALIVAAIVRPVEGRTIGESLWFDEVLQTQLRRVFP